MKSGLNKQKRIVGLVLVAYVVFILWKTLLCREPGPEYQLNLELFWSWRKLFDANSPQLMQVLSNIVLFIPFGGLLYTVLKGERKKRLLLTVLCGFLISSFIELSQLIFKLGLCELDDVLDNTIGTTGGAGIIFTFWRENMYARFFKRFLDFILSLCAVIVLSPLLLVLIILGSIFMGGNPFFYQERPGKDEKIFKLIKFRSMDNRKDKDGNLLPDNVRLNKYGRFLRSTSLDELPELINILKGDMSIIGPRPLLPRDVAYMDVFQKRRHIVRPGLTGLAQCSGRNSLDWDKKLSTDVEYVDNISFALDLRIFFKTIYKVLKREDIEFVEVEDMDLKDWNELKKRKAEEDGIENIRIESK